MGLSFRQQHIHLPGVDQHLNREFIESRRRKKMCQQLFTKNGKVFTIVSCDSILDIGQKNVGLDKVDGITPSVGAVGQLSLSSSLKMYSSRNLSRVLVR